MKFPALLPYLSAFALALPATAQNGTTVPVSIRYVATKARETKTSTSFLLQGGAADVALPLGRSFSAALEVAGSNVRQVPNTDRGLSTIALLAGPRFTVPAGRVSVSAQTLFGAVRGFDAEFTTGAHGADTATAFAFSAGGFLELALSRAFSLRAVQVDYLQTYLPNEADNRQSTLRVGAGVVFHVRLPERR